MLICRACCRSGPAPSIPILLPEFHIVKQRPLAPSTTTARSAPTAATNSPDTTASWSAPNAATTSAARTTTSQCRAGVYLALTDCLRSKDSKSGSALRCQESDRCSFAPVWPKSSTIPPCVYPMSLLSQSVSFLYLPKANHKSPLTAQPSQTKSSPKKTRTTSLTGTVTRLRWRC